MKKFRKVMAAVMAVATMAVSVAGLSASAYSPTITKTVSGVTGTLYSETAYGYGTTSCSGATCYVKVKHGGVTSSWVSGTGSVSYKNTNNNGSTSATSSHKTGSTSQFSITF